MQLEWGRFGELSRPNLRILQLESARVASLPPKDWKSRIAHQLNGGWSKIFFVVPVQGKYSGNALRLFKVNCSLAWNNTGAFMSGEIEKNVSDIYGKLDPILKPCVNEHDFYAISV